MPVFAYLSLKFKALELHKKLNDKKFDISKENLQQLFNVENFNIDLNSLNTKFNSKVEWRPIITNVITLLELFQTKSDDKKKTQTIENLQKNFGSDRFQDILLIAKLVNNKIDDLVLPFTTFEKKYSSRLTDL